MQSIVRLNLHHRTAQWLRWWRPHCQCNVRESAICLKWPTPSHMWFAICFRGCASNACLELSTECVKIYRLDILLVSWCDDDYEILIQLKLGDLKDEKTEQKSFNIEIWNLLLATRLFVSDYAFIFIFSHYSLLFTCYSCFLSSCFLPSCLRKLKKGLPRLRLWSLPNVKKFPLPLE